VKKWLLRHPRFHLHFTPTSSSWVILAERWFAELTNRKLRRSAHRSVTELEAGQRPQHKELLVLASTLTSGRPAMDGLSPSTPAVDRDLRCCGRNSRRSVAWSHSGGLGFGLWL
jgi:hypothetical protein